MSEKFLFPRLNNQNYSIWKTRMEMLLKREERWYVITDVKPEPVTNKWTTDDMKCHAVMVLYLEDNQLNLVKDASSAKEVWDSLKQYHEKTTMTSRVSLLKKICNSNFVDGEDLEKHLYDLEELFIRLACAGQALEESLQIAMILRSLPDSYSGLVTALESRPEADLTMSLVKQKLLDEYQRRKERCTVSGEKAMKMQSGQQKKRLCFHCQKPGHFRKDCRLWQQLQMQQNKSGAESGSASAGKPKAKKSDAKAKLTAEQDVPICFTVGNRRRKGCWYIDSGCSCHMTNDREFFTELDESKQAQVVLADGSVSKSHGIGEGIVKCVNGKGSVLEVKLTEVLFIPALDSGLISVRKLTQKGFVVNFVGSVCSVQSEAGKTVALGELNGSLFVLKTVEYAKLSAEVQHLPNCQHIWHRRFGHRDPAV